MEDKIDALFQDFSALNNNKPEYPMSLEIFNKVKTIIVEVPEG